MLSVVLDSLKIATFSTSDSAKTLSSICLLIAQRHKDRKIIFTRNNTHIILVITNFAVLKLKINVDPIKRSFYSGQLCVNGEGECIGLFLESSFKWVQWFPTGITYTERFVWRKIIAVPKIHHCIS